MKYGGDDITDFFTRLLLRSAYPWPDLDLHKSVDFRVLQYAKERWCTLFENEVAMQLGESVIRNKGEKTKKFSWRVYDEVYLAPLVPRSAPTVFGFGLMGGYVFTADDGEGGEDADETYDYKSQYGFI
jgi:hypothetical protein